MAQPERSFGKSFNRLGRLENAWAAAVALADPAQALDRLRKLYQRFEEVGAQAAAVPQWLAFQDSVLDARFLPQLQEADFDRLRDLGTRMAEANGFEPARSWWPLIEASIRRGSAIDYQRAYRLLTTLYGAPTSNDEIKLHAAGRLAKLEAVGEEQLAVYADVITRVPQPPAEVAVLVDGILNVGFESETEQLRRAHWLAWRIGDSVQRADVLHARAIGELLLHEHAEHAASMFESVLRIAPGHAAATRGLLAAHLQARDFRMGVAVGARTSSLDPRSRDLLTLCQVLAWFEVRWKSTTPLLASATPPATVARLAEISPGRDTGPWRDYALGRAQLLDGEARHAEFLLASAESAGLTGPDVQYHLAWARLLSDDPEGVRACYDAVTDEAGKWALRCLLQDADPAHPLPSPEPFRPVSLTKVARARQALIGDGPLPERVDIQALVTPDALQPDLFEALRTALGVAAARDQITELRALLDQALFARLPAAERLIWTALALRATNPERSRQMLRRSRELGRGRAAVLLAHDALENGRAAEIPDLLHDVRGRKADLLRACATAHSGDTASALRSFSELSAHGLAQAAHAMALVSLRAAAEDWAAGRLQQARTTALSASSQLRTGATRGMGRFEIAKLDHAARLLASAAGAEELTWQEVADQPWAARLLALVRLARAPESVDAELIRSLGDWPLTADAGVAQLSAAMLRVAVCAQDAAGAGAEAARFLIQLDERLPDAGIGGVARSAAACVALRNGETLDTPSDEPLPTLLGAAEALAGGDREAAIRLLRAARTERADRLGALAVNLADALDGTTTPEPLPFAAPETVSAALAAATAAGHVAAGNTAALSDALLKALSTNGGYVDPVRALPQLVKHAAKRGRRDAISLALAPIVRQAAADADGPGGIGSLTVARYATIAGDLATAEQAWLRALDALPSDDDRLDGLRGEYGRFLCHRAALADLDGDRQTALTHLRRAALYAPGKAAQVLADLEAEQQVSSLLGAFFPDSPIVARQRPGRHPRLAELLAANPELRRAVLAGDAERASEQWWLATAAAGRDIELWHTFAILAREDALARPAGELTTDGALAYAVALWTVLVSDPSFRAYFAGHTLPGAADDALRDELVEELLVGLKTRFTQSLAEDDLGGTIVSLACLNGVRQGLASTRKILSGGKFDVVAESDAGDERAFAPIAERAGRLIDEWGVGLVAASERALTDGAAIKRLGEDSKLDKNYPGAIAELEIVTRLDCPQRHALRAALNYGFDWWVCVHNQGETHTALSAVETVTPFAELLAPLCTPGQSHVAENKALCDYYYALGLAKMRLARRTGDDPLLDQSVRHLEESSAWNPDDDAVHRELARGRGRQLFRRGDYAEAERVLRGVRDNGRELAILFNDYGIDRLNAARAMLKIARTVGQLDAAQDPADESERMLVQASKIDPADQVIVKNVKLIQNLKKDIEQTRRRLELA